VGTRDRIMSHLAATGEVCDDTGMASTVLAREVGYPGTSIAFAQLLSGMERSGLIRREVRGKRTYRITAAPGSAARMLNAGERKVPSRAGTAGVDYDELARRLLVQVVRELAAARRELGWPAGPAQAGSVDGSLQAVLGDGRPGDGALSNPVHTVDGALAAQLGIATATPGGQDGPGGNGSPGSLDGPAQPLGATGTPDLPGDTGRPAQPADAADAPGQPGDTAGGPGQPDAALEGTLADLQRELASARALHTRVTAENARLREQLRTARRSLARLRGRATRRPVTEDLDADETGLLDHLLSPAGKSGEGDVPAQQESTVRSG
jgi:hypothetical protein